MNLKCESIKEGTSSRRVFTVCIFFDYIYTLFVFLTAFLMLITKLLRNTFIQYRLHLN